MGEVSEGLEEFQDFVLLVLISDFFVPSLIDVLPLVFGGLGYENPL